jgi:hypothetical protein
MHFSLLSRRNPQALMLVAGAAVASATASASAQVSFDLLTRFALGWGEEAVPITDSLQISHAGTYNFELQEGVFNAVGFENWGLANWIGTITASEPTLTRPSEPRPAPFNQIGNDGGISADGTVIGTPRQIDSAHAWEQYVYTDPGMVPQPRAYGNEVYVPVYRFSIVIDDLTPREISIQAEAVGLSRPLSGYYLFQNIVPNPETGTPGFVDYRPLALPPTDAQLAQLSLTFLQIVPAPGAGIPLGVLGLAVAARRRRRP